MQSEATLRVDGLPRFNDAKYALVAASHRAAIESKIDRSGKCWIWTGVISHKGYGSYAVRNATLSVNLRAHRLVFFMLRGDTARGRVLDHRCRNRACVRPDHMRVVTHFENALENNLGPVAMNARKVACVHGHPFTTANTIRRSRPNRRAERGCRACKNKRRRDARR